MIGILPLLLFRLPDSHDPAVFVPDQNIKKSISIDVSDAYSIVFSVFRGTNGLIQQQVLIDAIHAFTKRQEFDSLPVFLLGMFDHIDDLVVSDPSVWMEHQIEHAFLQDSSIECCLQVSYRGRVVWLMEMLGFPVAGNHAGELPAPSSDDIRVGIVLNRVDERGKRKVLVHPGAAITIDDKMFRKIRVLVREYIENTTVGLQEVSGWRSAVENLTPQTWAGCIPGITAGRTKSNRPIALNGCQQIDTPVIGGFGGIELVPLQTGTRMVHRVYFDRQPFREPFLKLRVLRID